MRRTGVLVILILAGSAHAGVLNVDNGQVGDGHVDLGVDEYGAYGAWLGPSQEDKFQPPGTTAKYLTYVGGAYIFITTPDLNTTAVLLNDQKKWFDYVEPMGDGIAGARETTLVRAITTTNTRLAANDIQSAFAITEPTAPAGQRVGLGFTLRQTLMAEAMPVSALRQTYAITNNGDLALQLVFSVQWDADLQWIGSPPYLYDDDIAGAGPGLCSVYEHEPGNTAMAATLSDGGSTVPISHYFAAKATVTPPNGPPAFTTTAGHAVFDARGIPVSWRDLVANVGYSTAGESGSSPGRDAMIGNEYRFALAVGQSVTIKVDRRYGTIAVACPPGPGCGNGVVDGGEACDSQGVDTATCNSNCTLATCGDGYLNTASGEECESDGIDSVECNGATCSVPACGDGYVNTTTGEMCDSSGKDTAECNGATCTAPACGDGHVNEAAGEQCEPGTSLCDDTTCRYAFTVGGGCAGCRSTSAPDDVALVGLVILLVRRRRSRRAAR